jgi:putative transposase
MADSTFIAEIPLAVSPAQARVLLDRFEIGRRLYNVLLQDALTRLDLMRQSKAWQDARTLPKGKARSQAFQAVQREHQFREYDLHALAAQHKHAAGWAKRISSLEVQKVASRVWQAVSEYAFGKRGRPRFKGVRRPLKSMEGKNNTTGLRWQPELGCVNWSGAYLPARLPTADQDPWLAEALKAKTKYVRLVWRMVKGRRRWFAQLIQAGLPPAKYAFLNSGESVGLDIGPRRVAVTSDTAVANVELAPNVAQPWAEIRTLQRALDRSRRATNPGNYHANGVVKKGAGRWTQSKRYKQLSAELAELERVLAETRYRDHGTLLNQILGLGTVVKTETLSYKALQKSYGRSVKVHAPGEFISRLTRKAESAGGKLIELDTWRLKMSQYDHVLGTCSKKPLSQRWHALGGGVLQVQRDNYSAWLAQHATGSEHNSSRLKSEWPGAESLLSRAGLCIDQPTSGRRFLTPTVGIPSESVARVRVLGRGLIRNAVGESREPERPAAVEA